MSVTTVQANGIEIEVEIRGDGAPLILIAGLGNTRWIWHRLVPHLELACRVLLPDNRGCGGTTRAPGPYSADLLASDIAGLLESLGIRRAHVAGHSMGGFVAQALALSRPDLVDRLILMGTNFGGPRHVPVTPEAMQLMLDLSGDARARVERGIRVSCAAGFAERSPELFEEWVRYRIRNPIEPEFYQAQLAVGLRLATEEGAFEHRLHAVRAPTLILTGDQDRVVPMENAELLRERIAGSQVRVIPGAGHLLPMECPERLAAEILGFLRQPPPPLSAVQ